ncbi:MAG: hypothetical protein DRH26_09390, partial [Deltaproteobacteria bacterium]
MIEKPSYEELEERIQELERLESDRRRKDEQLIHSYDLMDYIISHAQSAIAVFDRDFKYIYVSRRYLTDYKVKEKNIIGKYHYDIFPDIPQKWRDVHQKSLAGEVLSAEEDPYYREDGSIDWTRWECRPWYEYDGSIGGIVIYNEIINERKQANEELRKSEEKFRTAFHTSPNAININSVEDGMYIEINEGFTKILGYSREDAIGKTSVELNIWNDIKDRESLISRLKKDGVVENLEADFIGKNGQIKTGLMSAHLLRIDNQDVILSITRDITEQRKLEAQLRQAQKMESIGTLAGGIAHDFNNILFPILGYAEMLLEDVPCDSPFQNSLKGIYTSALRAKDLVKQILTFARQENSELMLMKMQPVIKEALKLIRSTIPTTIEIKQDINPDCGVIKADPTQIHQIIMNLATNAYHAMEEMGGELKVSLKEMEFGTLDLINPVMKPGSYACLTVADTGKGMDKTVTDKIFDPFFTTKTIGKGTGMGLSVVHGIVTAMGGAIHVYSEPGKGTQFHVYLPVEKSLSQEQAITSKAELQGGTEQILLVDDEEAILQMERLMLERLGYQVTSRTSSLEALEAFRKNPDKFDMVIT